MKVLISVFICVALLGCTDASRVDSNEVETLRLIDQQGILMLNLLVRTGRAEDPNAKPFSDDELKAIHEVLHWMNSHFPDARIDRSGERLDAYNRSAARLYLLNITFESLGTSNHK